MSLDPATSWALLLLLFAGVFGVPYLIRRSRRRDDSRISHATLRQIQRGNLTDIRDRNRPMD